VEGHDACRKIAILSSLAYGHHVDFSNIYTEGITGIRPRDFAYAREMGCCIKLLATSKKVNDKAFAMVAPMMISNDHPLSNVHGVFNAIFVKGNVIGDIMFYGSGAGKLPTASAVVADIVDAIKHIDKNIITLWYSKDMDLLSIEDIPVNMFIIIPDKDKEKALDLFDAKRVIEKDGEVGFSTGLSTEGEIKAKLDKLAEEGIEILSAIRIN